MAAGDNINVVNSKVTTLGTLQALTLTAADQTTDQTAQKFIYTPTGRDSKICLVCTNAVAFAVTVTIGAGTGVFGTAAKVNTMPATAGTYMIQFETGRYMKADGTIEISFIPVDAAKDLTNDIALKVGVIELQ